MKTLTLRSRVRFSSWAARWSRLFPPRRSQNGDEVPTPMCAIDMGSNSFKRIVGSFHHGRYEQSDIEKERWAWATTSPATGRSATRSLLEIEEALAWFKRSCESEAPAGGGHRDVSLP